MAFRVTPACSLRTVTNHTRCYKQTGTFFVIRCDQRVMALQDVTRFLASIGSPIVDENVDVPSKKIPSADALKLIDARIEALAPPSTSHPVVDEQVSSTDPPDEVCREVTYMRRLSHLTCFMLLYTMLDPPLCIHTHHLLYPFFQICLAH